MQDKTIVCKDCGKEFTFTVSEQEFYAEKDLNMIRLDVKSAELQKRIEIVNKICGVSITYTIF